MNRAVRWPAVFLPPACLLVMFLCITAWRLVDQEQTVERERVRERLENAASLVARESERALAQSAADERGSLTVRWDGRVLRRTGGRPLAWTPAPEQTNEALPSRFAQGEEIEIGKAQPERAIAVYRETLRSPHPPARAEALMRIARCQRKLGRLAEAIATYGRLAELGSVSVAGSPADLVGHRERITLLESAGDANGASQARERLKAALERGSHAIDRAGFEFFSQGIPIDPETLVWPDAVEQLRKHAAGSASGAAILTVKGRRLLAEWTREDNGGMGRLVDLRAVEERLTKALAASSFRWELTDAAGISLSGGAPPSGIVLAKRPAETGLAWGVKVAVEKDARSGVAFLPGGLAGGLVLLSLAILGTLYLAYRAVRRELHVAKMQSEFVAAVSHEFRTPITALTHLTEMLESGDAAEDRKPLYFRALARETRRLRRMVENLLDFGRIEAGRYKYKPEDIEATEFVRGVLEEFRVQPVAEGHELILEEGSGGCTITADREALRRALWNLLDNAAKYSPAGSRITAQLAKENGWIGVGVLDQGPGIAPEERKRIFQKFVRGKAAGQQCGTGIGLAMVDAIARAHGGRVRVESRTGGGSRFTILLPCQPAAKSVFWRKRGLGSSMAKNCRECGRGEGTSATGSQEGTE